MSSYDQLCEKSREISLLGNTLGVLGWDQETYMPKGGLQYRAKQLSWLSEKCTNSAPVTHFAPLSKRRSPRLPIVKPLPSKLPTCESSDINSTDTTKLPQSLVEKDTETSSLAKMAWANARESSDFTLFAPHLKTSLDIAREKAELWGYDDEPYDALLTGYERASKTTDIAAIFDAVSDDLASIAAEAVEKSSSIPSNILEGHYPIEKQQLLNREIAEDIGFNFENGRIDTTTHPFCTGIGPRDTRLTTRYLENDFTSSLFGVLHESGHGLYDQGLPTDQHGLPVGNSSSLGIHESQSRLWENHIGRSRAFWTKWLPRAQEIFPHLAKVGLDNFLTFINRAKKSFIRVEADEATYDLHILLRFDLERRMLNGEIDVDNVPNAWNEQFRLLFGTTPPDDTHGCLQDIHWSMGGLGYFATYTMGNSTPPNFTTAR